MNKSLKHEKSFDPADWQSFRAKGHEIFDDMVDHIANLRERPAWQPMDEGAIAPFMTPIPQEGKGFHGAYEDFTTFLKPYQMGLNHPGSRATAKPT